MKKYALFGAVILIILIAVFGIISLTQRNITDKTLDDYDISTVSPLFTVFRSNSEKEVRDNCESNSIELSKYSNGLFIGFDNIDLGTVNATTVFQITDGKITETRVKLTDSSISNNSNGIPYIKRDINFTKRICYELFGKPLGNSSYIYHKDGYMIDSEEDETYQLVLDGNAKFTLFVRDKDDSLWKIEGIVEENYYAIYMSRYFDVKEYENIVADIVLS